MRATVGARQGGDQHVSCPRLRVVSMFFRGRMFEFFGAEMIKVDDGDALGSAITTSIQRRIMSDLCAADDTRVRPGSIGTRNCVFLDTPHAGPVF